MEAILGILPTDRLQKTVPQSGHKCSKI